MGQGASSRAGKETSTKLKEGESWMNKDPDPQGKFSERHYRLCIIVLGAVSVTLSIPVIVLAVFQHMRSLGAGASSAVPSLGNLERGQHWIFIPNCLDGWIGYRGKCYYFSEEEKSWGSSQHFCTSVNASLATIDTQQEKDFMMRYAGFTEHWIGLRRESDQSWKWVNGTQFNQLLFQVKAEGDCAYLSDVFVSSSRCYSRRNWICSIPDAYTTGKENAADWG